MHQPQRILFNVSTLDSDRYLQPWYVISTGQNPMRFGTVSLLLFLISQGMISLYTFQQEYFSVPPRTPDTPFFPLEFAHCRKGTYYLYSSCSLFSSKYSQAILKNRFCVAISSSVISPTLSSSLLIALFCLESCTKFCVILITYVATSTVVITIRYFSAICMLLSLFKL